MKKMEVIFYLFLMVCIGFVAYSIISKMNSEKEFYEKSIEKVKMEIELMERQNP